MNNISFYGVFRQPGSLFILFPPLISHELKVRDDLPLIVLAEKRTIGNFAWKYVSRKFVNIR